MKTADKPPAILLGGGETAVPVCRSLGRGGVPVVAVGGARDPVRYSRYCKRYVEATAADDGEEWLEQLLAALEPGVLVPVSDRGVECVARNREVLLERGYLLLGAHDKATLSMLDKGKTYAIASEAGIPVPRFAVLREPDDLDAALRRVPLPCGIKPLEGHVFRERTGIADKVIRVADRDSFERLATPLLEAGMALMATEIVGGRDDQIYSVSTYIDEDGEPLFTFGNRKLRQDPPHFGVGTYVVQEDEPTVTSQGLRFLAAAGYRGLAHVEFKRDPADGHFKLIECNPRFNLAIELIIASGIDAPLLAYRNCRGEHPPQPEQRRRGLHLLHPLPDYRTMQAERAAGETTFATWAKSLLHRQRLTLFAIDDPRPSLVVNARSAIAAAGKRAGMSRPAA